MSIKLGRHSYCYGTQRGTMNTIHVGNFSSIAENTVFDGGFNHEQNITTFPLSKIWSDLPSNIKKPKDIIIGNDVWIGEGCFIMSGVTIGNGAIVGCNSVVTKDVPPYCVVAGSPARIKGRRFSSYQIEQLELIKWWDFTDEKIREVSNELQSTNIQEFINKHKP